MIKMKIRSVSVVFCLAEGTRGPVPSITALLAAYVQTSRYSDNKTMNCHKIDGFLVILDHVSHSNVEDGKE